MANDGIGAATIVLFGGTGDLATRKLLPALFDLWEQGRLKNCLIVGIGRRCKNREEYLSFLPDKVGDAAEKPEAWRKFSEAIGYHQGEIETAADFQTLKQTLLAQEEIRGLPGNRLFYCAVGPKYFAPIAKGLGEAGLLYRQSQRRDRWARMIVEKPFGRDLQSAKELDGALLAVMDENQIYRIDHYLGKETVQNVLAFRFANGLFEPVWNQKYVASVQITVAESLGVEDRGGYYDQTGALRDMMQNHMLQLLSVTAMEPPVSLDADSVRDEKVKTLRAIRLPTSAAEVDAATVRGQYGPGKSGDKQVAGYLQEPGVAPDSTTPTFVAARLFLDNWRWANVPFYLRHGKRMAKRGTEIAIAFRTPPLALFRGTEICGHCTNTLVIRVQPNEGISLLFGAKRPGAGMTIDNVAMDFEYETAFHQRLPDAYERLLLDALTGDPTLFTRSDEVRMMWRWADAIIDGWSKLPPPQFPNYPAGGWGPPDAENLFPQPDHLDAGLCPVSWRRW